MRLIIIIFLTFFTLHTILSFLKPDPKTNIVIPKESFLGEDVEIKITVSHWHPNIGIQRIRFYVDNASSTACLEGKSLYPIILYEQEQKKPWSYWAVYNLIWPKTEIMMVRIPLQKLFQNGFVKLGVLKGNIDVAVVWVSSWGRRHSLLRERYHVSERTNQIPFELVLREKN